MSNGTYSDNFISGNKKDKLVSWMRKNYKNSTELLDDSSVYRLAQDYFPEYEYEDWDESEYDYDYSDTPENIDTSPDSLNSLQHTKENLTSIAGTIPQDKLESSLQNYYSNEKQKDKNREELRKSLKDFDLYDDAGFLNFESISEFALGDMIMPLLSDKRKKSLQRTINERVAGLNYRIHHGEDKYKIDETPIMMGGEGEYEPGIMENIVNTVLSTGAADLASWTAASKVMKLVNPQMGSTLLKAATNSQVGKWIASRTPNFINKTIPNSKIGISLKKGIFKNFDKYKAADQMFTIGQINGMIMAHHGAAESVANQLQSKGKYEGQNGTINLWDTSFDITKAYAEGVAVGSLVGVQNNLFDSALKHSSKLIKGGNKIKGRVLQGLTNPASKFASHGITYTTMPLIWDKERRASYIDKDGNIDFAKYWSDIAVMSGYSLALVGTSQALGIYGNAKQMKSPKFYRNWKKIKLSKKERETLRTKWKESQKAAIGRGEKDVSFDNWMTSLDKGELANIMRGKQGIPSTLSEKLKSYIGIRPTMPWDRNSKIVSSALPSNLSLPKTLENIRNNVKKDIAYENSKKTNTNLQTNQQKSITESKQNVIAELKGKVPYEFFEETINDISTSVDMGNGLKSIYDIATESLRIIDKITIKDANNEVIGVDNSLATNEELYFLQSYAPSVIPAYQGYKDTYLTTDEGKESYIKRYESEKGVTLTEKQKKLLLDVAKNQNDQLDEIRDYLNRKRFHGVSKTEQPIVKDNKVKPELSPKYKECILLDENGIPINGERINLDKAEADRLIELGRAMTSSKAKNENISTFEVTNESVGNRESLESKVDDLHKGAPLKLDTNIPRRYFESWMKELDAEIDPITFKTKSIGNNVLATRIKQIQDDKGKQIIQDSAIDGIKDLIDIKVLSQADESLLRKYVSYGNKLIKHSGKDSFSEIETDDIKRYFDSRINDKKKLNQSPSIDDTERTALRKLFNYLKKKDAITENPYDEIMVGKYTKQFNELKGYLKKKNVTITEFWQNLDKLKGIVNNVKTTSNIKKLTDDDIKVLKAISKETKIPLKVLKEDKGRLSTALKLFYKFPIRDQEVNAIKPSLIKMHDDGNWYIDLLLSRDLGGAGKGRGKKRPVPISEEMAKEILNHGKQFGMDKEVFPNYAGHITKILKSTLGLQKNPQEGTARQFKSQLKVIAEQHSGLLPDAPFTLANGTQIKINEPQIYGIVAGHETGGDAISKFYTDPQNFTDFFAMAKQVLDKVNKVASDYGKPIPVVSKQQMPAAGKAVSKVLKKASKALKPGLSIKDISGKSDKDVVDLVSNQKPNTINKKVQDKYRTSVSKELNRQTLGMSKSNKEEFITYHAKNAGIINFTDFNVKNAPIQDLISFSSQILTGKQDLIDSKKIKYKTLDMIDKARALANRADMGKEEINDIVRLKFRKQNIIELDYDESVSLCSELALNQDFRDRGVWSRNSLEEENFITIVKKIPDKKIHSIIAGTSGQFKQVMYMLEEKYGLKGAKSIADATLNHIVHEGKVQGYLNDFETECYYILADKKLRLGGRQRVARRNAGRKAFDKIKDNIWWLQEDQWFALKEFVKKNPQHKDIVSIYNKSKKFMDNVYDEKGILKIDTPESRIARAWHKMTEKIKESYIDGLKANMTKAQFETWMKNYGVKWIDKTFYVTKTLTKDFIDNSNLEGDVLQKLINKNAKSIAIDRAIEKHGANPTNKQIEDEMDASKIESFNALERLKKYSPMKVKARYLLDRKFNLPPVLLINGKPTLVWETSYDNFATSGVAGQAKLSATIKYLPFMSDIKGLPPKFNHIPKLISEIGAGSGNQKVKDVGKYIKDMIYSRVGLVNRDLYKYESMAFKGVAGFMNFLNKSYLSFYTAAIKNAGLGQTMNANMHSDNLRQLAVMMNRALSFEAREEAKGLGLIQLSLSAIETKAGIPKITPFLFEKGKFQSSEEWTRLTNSLMALCECPYYVDVLRAGPSINYKNPVSKFKPIDNESYNKVVRRCKLQYDLTDEEIYLLREHGLNSIDAEKYPVYKASTKRTRTLKEEGKIITFDGRVLTDAFDIAQEQSKLDHLHQKLITQAHINAQGATSEIYQPTIFQNVWAGGAFQFQKMAVNWHYNIRKVYEINRKNGNWYRSAESFLKVFGTQTIGGGLTGSAIIGLMALLKIMPDDRELDDKLWKKYLKALIKGDAYGYIFTPFLKLGKGETMQATDFISVVPYKAGMEIFGALMDIAKWHASKIPALQRKGSSSLENQLIYSKFPLRNLEDVVINLNSMIRNLVKSYTNIRNPYNLLQEELKKWEKKFLETTVYTKADLKTARPMSPFNDAFITSFNRSDDHKKTAERLLEKYQAHYTIYRQQGKTHEQANADALEECQNTLDRLCPLSIGKDEDGRTLNISRDFEFQMYLINTAIKQNQKDPLVHWKKLKKGVDMWHSKQQKVVAQFKWLLRNDEKLKNETNALWMKKILPSNLKDLGFSFNSKGELILDPRVEKALKEMKKLK